MPSFDALSRLPLSLEWPKGLLTQCVAYGDVGELLDGPWALMPEFVHHGLVGGLTQ
jgi:hypothetical protein